MFLCLFSVFHFSALTASVTISSLVDPTGQGQVPLGSPSRTRPRCFPPSWSEKAIFCLFATQFPFASLHAPSAAQIRFSRIDIVCSPEILTLSPLQVNVAYQKWLQYCCICSFRHWRWENLKHQWCRRNPMRCNMLNPARSGKVVCTSKLHNEIVDVLQSCSIQRVPLYKAKTGDKNATVVTSANFLCIFKVGQV